jgi:alpha-mannosidase
MKLVELVDKLLDILEMEDDYKYFMLDGQTIVLEDYLEIRPQNRNLLEKYIKNGRILVGPWYVLPDEFLVSPEAIIRNLLIGKKICEQFGSRMMIGYIPDPFGHIGQMPQILQGFGIKNACFRRGLADEPIELWWEAPDGSKVLTSYLRDGYDNAVNLPLDSMDNFLSEVNRFSSSLKPYLKTNHLLLMNGSDHIEPDGRTPKCIQFANKRNQEDVLLHSTLEKYFVALEEEINSNNIELPTVHDELRECKRHELLPGVLSTRNWIKQRDQECERLLEKWVEPFTAWASFLDRKAQEKVEKGKQIIEYAWKLLLKCHPHDSICGCSIDQVYKEMAPRFDQVEQIGERIALQSLNRISRHVQTTNKIQEFKSAIVVFNASQYPQTGMVSVEIPLPAGSENLQISDSDGNLLDSESEKKHWQTITELSFDTEGMKSAIFMLSEGKISGMSVLDIGFSRIGQKVEIELVLDQNSVPNLSVLEKAKHEIVRFFEDITIQEYAIKARTPVVCNIRMLAEKVPGFGYKTFWVKSDDTKEKTAQILDESYIENEFIHISVDPKLNKIVLLDKESGSTFVGLNEFEDSGDAGDKYNYNPPPENETVYSKIQAFSISKTVNQQVLNIKYSLQVPNALSDDRKTRIETIDNLNIESEMILTNGVPRIDIKTTLDNQAKDHRLRVLFPTGIATKEYITDNHFLHTKREITEFAFQDGWMEQPRPEVPQRLFSMVSKNEKGILVANCGLPEVEVFQDDNAKAVIAITLLRCTGWLSRDDLKLRPRAAGPVVPTPDAQELGKHVFNYSIIPFGKDYDKAVQEAQNFDSPLRAIFTDLHQGELPSQNSFIKIQPTDFEISTIKLAEDGSGWIVRGVNQNDENIKVSISSEITFNQVFIGQLDEQKVTKIEPNGNTILINAEGHQIKTIRFE